jgi:acyl-CoA oxidase
MVTQDSISDIHILQSLFMTREAKKLSYISDIVAGIGPSQPDVFDAWMYQESDAVQGCTQAFGERQVLDACINVLASSPENLKPVLTDIVCLYAMKRMEDDLAWFMYNNIIPNDVAQCIPDIVRSLCKRVSHHWQVVIDSFDIPERLVSAPIAGNWEDFNTTDNQGEVLGISF